MSEIGKSVLRGAREALAHARGDAVATRETLVPVAIVDVKAVRESLGLTQRAFADRFGVSVGTLRDWEQGHRRPEGAARVLLTVIEHEPDAVERALSRAGAGHIGA